MKDKLTGKMKISYNADSPDEVALVQGAGMLGYTFTGTKSGGITTVKDSDTGEGVEGGTREGRGLRQGGQGARADGERWTRFTPPSHPTRSRPYPNPYPSLPSLPLS